MLLISATLALPASPTIAEATTPPSIVLIVTDDQRWDTLWAMPNVQSDLVGHGVRFKSGFVVNSFCCPSRATILTGRYSHSTGVYRNGMEPFGYQDFDENSTVATWLHSAGYRTGLIGKYLGGYSESLVTHVPSGWDRWFAFVSGNGNGNYFEYSVSNDGTLNTYGEAPQDYSTDVLGAQAVSFIEGTSASQPLFLYFAPRAPHEPATPAPRHADAFADLQPYRPDNYDEEIVADKPDHIANHDRISPEEQIELDALRINEYRTLLAVDEAVAGIVDALERTGRLSTTLIAFISDNGYLLGEHRTSGKKYPYEESIRVPLVVRYDPMTTKPRTDGHLALNMDLAPTFAALAGAATPTVDGASLLPLLVSKQNPWRQDFLIENSQAVDHLPKFCAVRTRRYLYVNYGTSEHELYDIKVDPYEMDNLADDPAHQALLLSMNARMRALCSPPPPGFVPIDLSGELGSERASP
jgi:N-acetylglucosamine-6-sulfatase